jgi:pimeloyl-ACP methyl ester carboxylesterase
MDRNGNSDGNASEGSVPSVRERSVTVHGRQMALLEAGTGKATVVFDAGLGDSSASWDVVQSAVSRLAQTVSYDRAGRGQSHFVPGSRTSLDIANDLHAMLEAAQIPGPYILVGHSFGGYNIRVFADRFPDLVAGLILVDSSHELQAQAFAQLYQNLELPVRKFAESEALVFARQEKASFADPLYPANFLNPEGIDFALTCEQVRQAQFPVHAALTVITAVEHHWWWFPDLSGLVKEISDSNNRVWQDLQTQLLQLSARGRQVMAAKSHHYVHHEEPEIVIEAIRQMIDSSHSK